MKDVAGIAPQEGLTSPPVRFARLHLETLEDILAANFFGFGTGVLADLAYMPLYVVATELISNVPVNNDNIELSGSSEATTSWSNASLPVEYNSDLDSYPSAALVADTNAVVVGQNSFKTMDLSLWNVDRVDAEGTRTPSGQVAETDRVFTDALPDQDFDSNSFDSLNHDNIEGQPGEAGHPSGSSIAPATASDAGLSSSLSQNSGATIEFGNADQVLPFAANTANATDIPALASILNAAPLAANPAANPSTVAATSTTSQQPQMNGNALLAEVASQGIRFEQNVGQFNANYNFVANASNFHVGLSATGSTMVFTSGDTTTAPVVLTMQLVGGNANATPVGHDQMAGITNYLSGDPSQNHTGIVSYAQATYQNVYQGIDAVYHTSAATGQLEYDFVVAPNADANQVALHFRGAQDVQINAAGQLVLQTAMGDVVQHIPTAYQLIDGIRQAVDSRFVQDSQGNIKFALGSYNHSYAITIDPSYVYASYLGGTGTDNAEAIAFGPATRLNPAGVVYVTGNTNAAAFRTNPNDGNGPINPLKLGTNLGVNAFVIALSPNSNQVQYLTFIGGDSGAFPKHGYAASS